MLCYSCQIVLNYNSHLSALSGSLSVSFTSLSQSFPLLAIPKGFISSANSGMLFCMLVSKSLIKRQWVVPEQVPGEHHKPSLFSQGKQPFFSDFWIPWSHSHCRLQCLCRGLSFSLSLTDCRCKQGARWITTDACGCISFPFSFTKSCMLFWDTEKMHC